MTWYDPEEIQAEALGAKRQPEFAPEPEPDDPEDLTWEGVEALFARHGELDAIVAGITQPYPTVSGDVATDL